MQNEIFDPVFNWYMKLKVSRMVYLNFCISQVVACFSIIFALCSLTPQPVKNLFRHEEGKKTDPFCHLLQWLITY